MHKERPCRFMEVLLKEYRVEVLSHAASGVLLDPEAAAIWMELFQQHDPVFAGKLKKLLDAPTREVFAELSWELFPDEPARPYVPVGPGEYA